MFTGLIEEIGIVKSIIKGGQSAQITIQAHEVLNETKIGDSICTNGVCLTVTKFTHNSFTVDVMPETMRKSNLGKLTNGSKVNLERALKASDRLGGHIVSGHIDGTGTISQFKEEENATWITVNASNNLLKYIIDKGSIAIDGTSLTVAKVDQDNFKVSIIPHTKEKTILISKKVGDDVNLECDIIGKYVERLMGFKENNEDKQEGKLSIDFLKQNGF